MAEAQLRWKAQTSEAEARILALKAVVDSLGGEQTTTRLRSVSSSLDKIGTDAEKAGKKADYAFRDAFKAVDKFGSGLSGPFGILKPIGLLIQGWSKVSQVVGIGTKALGDALTPIEGIATEGGQAAGMLTQLGGAMGPLVAAGGPLVAIFVALGGALLVLPALIAAVVFAMTALADVVGILAALVAGFTGPLLTLAGLLGGLAAAFVLGGKAALTSKTGFDGLQERVKQLGGEFAHFTRDLGHVFLPYFWQLAAAAQTALNYFDKLSKMNLGEAFRSLNTQGVHLLDKFVRGLAGDIAKPFRLAIKIAFGKESNIGNVLGGWIRDISKYLTGVHGALNPFVRWFNEQHFTDTGLRWATEIITAIENSRAWSGFKDAIVAIATNAGTAAGHAFVQYFKAELAALPGAIASAVSANNPLNFTFVGPLIPGGPGQGARNPSGQTSGGDPGSSPGNPVAVRGHRAAGGVVSPNSSYIVGEHGEEMLTLGPHGGYITPAGPRHGAWTRPQIIQLHVDLGRGVKQVVQFELRNTARGLQAARAWGG